MKSLLYDYSINPEISEQNTEIKNLIKDLNFVLEGKKYENIILNSLSIVWKETFSISYWLHARNQQKDVSDFPWISLESYYWKDIYNYKECFAYLNDFDILNDKNLIFLNSILSDILNVDFALYSKRMVRDWKTIHETLDADGILSEMNFFLDILNNWINKKFEASMIWYLTYIFFNIHPFRDWNGRTMRVLIDYILMKKLWSKAPCAFLNFYLNYTKQEHYFLLEQLNLKINWSLEKFIYSINKGIIEQIKISIEIFKDLDKYINEMILDLKKAGFTDKDLITDIYKNIYFENKIPYNDEKLEKLLDYLKKNKWFKAYMDKWKLYYYDLNFVNLLKNRY